MVLLEADLSLAEDRVVKVLTHVPHLITIARTPPWEIDTHALTASLIFRQNLAEKGSKKWKDQRYVAKRTRHGLNYGMQSKRLSDVMLHDGFLYSPDECQQFMDRLNLGEPEITQVYQKQTRMLIMRERRLRTSWGHELSFEYDRLDNETYKRGYAFRPQSEVGCLLNQYGFFPLHRWLKKEGLRSRINLQVHDSVVVSCPVEEVWEVATFLKHSLEQPRQYEGVELVIPVELKVGANWGEMHEWKRWPKRKELEEVARSYDTPTV